MQRYSGLAMAAVGVMLMLDARLDYAAGFLKPFAAMRWFAGGVLASVALFCWVWGWWLLLGVLRYPVAVVMVAASIYALLRFRPTNHSGEL